MATRRQQQAAALAKAAEIKRDQREADQRLQPEVESAQRRLGLVTQVMVDRAVARAAAGQAELVAVVWGRHGGAANVNGHQYQGAEGALSLVPEGVARVLDDSGAATIREPLQLPPGQRPEAAAELRAAAAELLEAAAELDPEGV